MIFFHDIYMLIQKKSIYQFSCFVFISLFFRTYLNPFVNLVDS